MRYRHGVRSGQETALARYWRTKLCPCPVVCLVTIDYSNYNVPSCLRPSLLPVYVDLRTFETRSVSEFDTTPPRDSTGLCSKG